MILSLGVLGLLWRGICLALLTLVLTELTWAQRRNGHALKALRGVIASMLFVIAFPFVAALDSHTDLSPGFAWRAVLEQWVWIGYATLAGCLLRFWLDLHRWARGKNGTV